MQPTIRPLFDTKTISGSIIKVDWKRQNIPRLYKRNLGADVLKGGSWNQALHDGVFVGTSSFRQKKLLQKLRR